MGGLGEKSHVFSHGESREQKMSQGKKPGAFGEYIPLSVEGPNYAA